MAERARGRRPWYFKETSNWQFAAAEVLTGLSLLDTMPGTASKEQVSPLVTNHLEPQGFWGVIYRAAAHNPSPREVGLGLGISAATLFISKAMKDAQVIRENQALVGGADRTLFERSSTERVGKGAGTVAAAGILGYAGYRLGGSLDYLQGLGVQLGTIALGSSIALYERFRYKNTLGGIRPKP